MSSMANHLMQRNSTNINKWQTGRQSTILKCNQYWFFTLYRIQISEPISVYRKYAGPYDMTGKNESVTRKKCQNFGKYQNKIKKSVKVLPVFFILCYLYMPFCTNLNFGVRSCRTSSKEFNICGTRICTPAKSTRSKSQELNSMLDNTGPLIFYKKQNNKQNLKYSNIL